MAGPDAAATPGLSRLISPGGFRLLRVRMLAGRGFSAPDVSQAAAAAGKNLFHSGGKTGQVAVAAVVNEKLARLFWPGGEARALGRRLWWGSVPCRVVGVVANIRESPGTLNVRPTVYLPFGWNPYGEPFLSFAVRVRPAAARRFAEMSSAALAALLPGLPPLAVSSLQAQVESSWAGLRPALELLGVFALLGLIVAGLGVYACAADAAGADSREMGVRAALGAAPGEIWRLMQWRNLRVLGVALAAGAIGAFLAARALSHWLFAVTAADPATYCVAAALLAAVAIAAVTGPAARTAWRLPAEVLRE
ncbi:MAG: FtsX-like permease family protein [Terriglobales bacterium]